MTLDLLFETYKAQVKETFVKQLQKEEKRKGSPPLYKEAINQLTEFGTRGKLIRGCLLLLGQKLSGGEINKNILNIALALELTHSALLIHDDIIDNDRLRRGQKTIFFQYAEKGNRIKARNPLLYGQSMAICIGDTAFFLAYKFLNEGLKDTSHQLKFKITQLYTQEIAFLATAQMQDSYFGMVNKNPTASQIIDVYLSKSARYTFSLPLVIGAVLAGAHENVTKLFWELGEHLGILFQIKDDELGLFGSPKTTGKPTDGDIKENKKTLHRFFLFQKATQPQKKKLNHIFGTDHLTSRDIKYVRFLVHSLGVIQELENIKQKHTNEIKDLMKRLKPYIKNSNLLDELFLMQESRIV